MTKEETLHFSDLLIHVSTDFQLGKIGKEHYIATVTAIMHKMSNTNKERNEKLDFIAKIFAKIMFYGCWKWETPNERVLEMLMKDIGYWPFIDEDDMIAKTAIPEELYKRAILEIPGRFVKNNNTEKETESLI